MFAKGPRSGSIGVIAVPTRLLFALGDPAMIVLPLLSPIRLKDSDNSVASPTSGPPGALLPAASVLESSPSEPSMLPPIPPPAVAADALLAIVEFEMLAMTPTVKIAPPPDPAKLAEKVLLEIEVIAPSLWMAPPAVVATLLEKALLMIELIVPSLWMAPPTVVAALLE